MKSFVLRDEDIVSNCLDYIANLPKEFIWRVEIREYFKKRSIQQNKRYWALVKQAAVVRETTPRVIHEFYKAFILGVRVEVVDNFPIHITRSTTQLSTKRFNDYVDECVAHAVTEWNVVFDDSYDEV